MSFWGVEVKPGKPYTHPSSKRVGRLRLSQATLGFGASQKKCLVQCNVGSQSAFLMCCLVPEKSECCHLQSEFDEDDETIFSVIGPRSVFLTGYYVISHKHSGFDDSSDSYGEDVGKSDTEKSNECSEEDEYEDSFINDNIEEVSPHSPAYSSEERGKVMHAKNSGDKKGSWRSRRLRKYQISGSEDDGSIRQQDVANGDAAVKLVGIEDEDNIPISSLTRRGMDRKAGKQEKGANDKVAKVGVAEKNPTREPGIQNTSVPATVEGLQPDEEEMNREKKREEKDKALLVESIEDYGICKEKRQVDETKNEVVEVAVDQSNNSIDQAIGNSNEVNADTDPKRLEDMQPEKEELKVEKKKGKIREKKRKALHVKSIEDDSICKENLQVGETNGHCQEPVDDKKPDVDAPQSDERNTKRKKRKSMGNEDLVSVEKKAMSTKGVTMAFPNGLKVEDLELGNPDGEIAYVGRKLTVHFTGKLKEGGHVFETRNHSNPFKFRLGKGNAIEGLELGLEGMRVGGRRRITIPPELGYESKGNADSVPPNAWLIVDVELIKVC